MSNELTINEKKTITLADIELVRRTVAKGATDDELKLYLHDCERQGVHPLDRLIYFTAHTDAQGKRSYTPITSIDFMRIRAAATDAHVGTDDPTYEGSGENLKARVTVYKLVQGQRCGFTATARWSEYYPGEKKGFMWRSKPFLMLGKCAEALALRKGFPKDLQGLYAKEEMDQAQTLHEPPKPKGRPKKHSPEELTAILIERAEMLESVELCDEALGKISDKDLGHEGFMKVRYAIQQRKEALESKYDSDAAEFFDSDLTKESGGAREPGQEG